MRDIILDQAAKSYDVSNKICYSKTVSKQAGTLSTRSKSKINNVPN